MAGDDALDLHRQQGIEGLLPAGEIAVGKERVKVGEEDIAAEEKFLSRQVDHQAAGGVRGGGAQQFDRFAAEIDEQAVAEGEARHGDFGAGHILRLQPVLAGVGKNRRAFFDEHVAVRLLGDHRCPEFGEDAVAEGVVEVGVGVDHVFDRLVSHLADIGEKALPLFGGDQRIDHQHAVAADDDPGIGGEAAGRRGVLAADVGVDVVGEPGQLGEGGLGAEEEGEGDEEQEQSVFIGLPFGIVS